MIARVQETTGGFVIVIPAGIAKAWELRENFPLEVHRVGSTSEADTPEAIERQSAAAMETHQLMQPQHEAAYRELAKGPEGIGPHDSPPFDLRKL
jgi:hypothetical protein